MKELLPCPFCGEIPHYQRSNLYGSEQSPATIRCRHCNYFVAKSGPGCDNAVFDLWNTRPIENEWKHRFERMASWSNAWKRKASKERHFHHDYSRRLDELSIEVIQHGMKLECNDSLLFIWHNERAEKAERKLEYWITGYAQAKEHEAAREEALLAEIANLNNQLKLARTALKVFADPTNWKFVAEAEVAGPLEITQVEWLGSNQFVLDNPIEIARNGLKE